MKRRKADTSHRRAEFEWQERHGHEAQISSRVVSAPAADAEMWEETRQRRIARRNKMRRRRAAFGWQSALAVVATGLASVGICFFIGKSHASYRAFDAQVQAKTAALESLQEQQKTAKAHLALLESDKGRAQLLVERGYVRPGERILLFPETPGETRNSARLPSNDLAPAPKPLPPTAWQRAGDAVRNWFD